MAVAVAVLVLGALALKSLPTVPAPATTTVVDDAGLLSTAQRRAIEDYHRRLLSRWDIDYRVVTRANLTDINSAAVSLFRAMGRESQSRSGRGLLLLIDPGTNQVRLEVGYPLEGAFPDAFVDYLERRQMVPFFERGRVADGIVATTELIVDRSSRAGESMGSSARPWATSSGGAGAVNDARVGAVREKAAGAPPDSASAPAAPESASTTPAGTAPAGTAPAGTAPAATPVSTGQRRDSPAATLTAYFRAMSEHDARPDLDIYTPATRALLQTWLVTPAQMDSVVRSYRACQAQPAIVAADGRRAVIRYPSGSRTCAPFFFQHSDRGWQLDLTMMHEAIRFNADNAWRLQPGVIHPYGFAFEDWVFDGNGFPQTAH